MKKYSITKQNRVPTQRRHLSYEYKESYLQCDVGMSELESRKTVELGKGDCRLLLSSAFSVNELMQMRELRDT